MRNSSIGSKAFDRTNSGAMEFTVRGARAEDGDAMLALMPRLADFDVPEHRSPEDLWRDDAALLRKWIAGDANDCFVHIAEDDNGVALGMTLVRIRPDVLSHEPSSHLEVITVSKQGEGKGVARALLTAAETEAAKQGALTMTLHVIATNSRARKFYERVGYYGEMIRYIRALTE
jgi:ribosomal protein S18 acetylase RimI-like enzyme